MIKYNSIKLEPWLTIGVSYDYTDMVVSKDYDIPNEPADISITGISLEKGTMMELLYHVDGYGKANGFSEWLETKLYELND